MELLKAAKRKKTDEEQEILNSIVQIRENISVVYEKLNYSADELITDSLNYELLALKKRHKYFLEKAKKMNLTNIM